MAVAKMKLVNIVGRMKDFDTVVQQCCIRGNFHPEQSSKTLENVEEFTPIEDPNPFEKTLQKTVDIGVHSDISLRYSNFDQLNMPFDQLAAYIDKLGIEIGALNKKVGDYSQKVGKLEQVLTQLSHMGSLGIKLEDVFGCQFIVFRFGRLPKDSYFKLEAGSGNDNYLFSPLKEDNLFYWGFYVAKKEMAQEADEYFSSLYFERISIIENEHGTPQEASEKIRKDLDEAKSQLEQAREEVHKYWSKNSETFLKVYSSIRYLHDSFDLRKYASKCDDNFYIFGWVPETEVENFRRPFKKFHSVDCIVESTAEAENVQPPTKLKNAKLFKPFELFVGMYGLPSYNEIDPTAFMAFTYTLFFGIMFGDLGHGLAIFAIGLLLYHKAKSDFSGILMRIGVSSMVFGALYNSFFGYENKLPWPAILPVHENANVTKVLFGAVGLGVVTIVACMFVNMANAIRQKDVGKLFFSHNGVSGMTFYVSIILAGALYMLYKINIISPVFVLCLVVVPLILIYLREPLANLLEHKKDVIPGSPIEFFLQSFFEVFEDLLSFMTNTISFMRIGAYILSHAGMMFAVFALAGMGGGQNIIVVVLGNVFVLALEGLIVGIQGIRLHFYEMFSRFYEGGGKPYEPAKINY